MRFSMVEDCSSQVQSLFAMDCTARCDGQQHLISRKPQLVGWIPSVGLFDLLLGVAFQHLLVVPSGRLLYVICL